MIGESNPIRDVERFARRIADLEGRLADVERLGQRRSPIVGFTAVRRGGGNLDIVGTSGGATAFGALQISDDKCFFTIKYMFGTSGAFANVGTTTFDAPVAFRSGTPSFIHVGSGFGIQGGARVDFEVCRDGSSDGFQLYGPTQYTQASPAVAQVGDTWVLSGWYFV